ncbi:MAG: flagellar biosynthetic protein FliO [Nitrospiria bacterium]
MEDSLSSLVKMISALFLVVGMILLCAYGAKRFLRGRLSQWGNNPLVNILSTTYLGPKKEISVIEVGEKYLVIGVTPNNISLLTALDQKPFPSGSSNKRNEIVSA